MILSKYYDRGCMRFGTTRKHETRRERKAVIVQAPVIRGIGVRTQRRYSKEKIVELLFEKCIDCERMAAIPQGAFAAFKVRRNLERVVPISGMEEEEEEKLGKEGTYNGRPPLEGWELTPLKYNSKLMNSIWGLYNRYSVHNFKKNTDSDEGVSGMFATVSKAFYGSHGPVANNSQIINNGNSI